MKVTILGLGIMGRGVAQTLLREGFDVTVWNRSADKALPFADQGATVAANLDDAVAGADVILSILFDADSVVTVLEQAAAAVPERAIWVQASTIGLDGTARVVAAADESGIRLVEAMMVGTKAPAETGRLVLLTGGADELLTHVTPILDAMGSKTIRVGSRVGDGTALKLAVNAWVASLTAATAQSLALARALGVDPGLFLQTIDGAATDSPYAHQKGAAMLDGEFPPSFALDGLRKDLGVIGQAARSAGVDATLIDALDAVYAGASALGHGGSDIAAVYQTFVQHDDAMRAL